MYCIRGINFTANSTKTVYVAEALGVDYEFVLVNMGAKEHKTPEHLARHPLGKVPTLEHGNVTVFESNAICTYMAHAEQSPLLPATPAGRALVDQWLNFFTNHVGRWILAYGFEKYMRAIIGAGETKPEVMAEASGYLADMLPAVEAHLAKQPFFAADTLTVADYVAFAYFEVAEKAAISLADFPALLAWYQAIKTSDVVARAHTRLGI